ncbi:hypothetical protein BGZ60DRAFT_537553 [Tricladium varicosporioides]|nr:hypothetical protein BGZ60DRAFT_537553 [Hymenoscyphus varicosporioides]
MDNKIKTPYATETPMDNNGHQITSSGMRGRSRDIILAFSTLTVPMIAFSATLLGLIYHYRIARNDYMSSNLRLDIGDGDSNAIYVNFSATALTQIASWSSTLAPILVGFAISLISYPVARSMLLASQRNDTRGLPTPYQFHLMFRMVANGSWISLWHWIKYTTGWTGRRESQGRPLKIMTWILFLSVFMSVIVVASDTWLHFATETINFTQIHANTIPMNGSLGLIPACINVNAPFMGGCTLNRAAANTFLMTDRDSPDPLQVLNNISDSTTVKTFVSNQGQYAFLGNTPSDKLAHVDYSAHSWAVKSSCTPVSSKCLNDDLKSGPQFPFNCTFAFQGAIPTTYQNAIAMGYFTDSTGANNRTIDANIGNPYYYAAIASVNQNLGRLPALQKETELYYGLHGSTVFVLWCSATVYDIEYSSINNTVTRFVTKPSNSSMVNIIQGSQQFTHVGDPSLILAASLSGFSANSQEVADRFALSYSRTALAVAVGAFTPQPAIESQLREDILVARVPIAPLAILIFSNLSFVILGIVLTIIAFVVVGKGETREIQARMDIAALVAAQFEGGRARTQVEGVENLFEENQGVKGLRVGVMRAEEGGWMFGSCRT